MMIIEMTTMSEVVAAELRREKTAVDHQIQMFMASARAAEEREATYQAALKLVARIDEDLIRGIRHYRTKAGALLTTLDEVIRAILDDQLEAASWAN